MTTVVVSPHLDDAVLSIPAVIRARRARGERVVVVTAFTEGDERHVARRAEDLAALDALGGEPLHLGLRDAPFRRRGTAEAFRDLVLSPLADDDRDARDVATTVARKIAEIAPDTTLLPLGVGEHIDHRIVHAVHALLAMQVGFYEDRPYALVRHAVRARLARLGAIVDGNGVEPSRAAADEYIESVAAAPYVRAYLPSEERAASLERLATPLVTPEPKSRLRLRRETIAFDASALERSVMAIRSYTSQLADLFGDAEIVTALTPRGEGYEERIYWRET